MISLWGKNLRNMSEERDFDNDELDIKRVHCPQCLEKEWLCICDEEEEGDL